MGPTSLAVLAQSEDVSLVGDEVTLSEVAQSVSIFVATVLLTILLRWALVRVVRREGDQHLALVLGRILSVVIVGVGLIYALDVVGVRIGPLIGALGIGGIALAFAAQDILANFVSGVLLGIRRPIRFGEQIRTGEHEGIVRDVNLRTVELLTYDGNTVLVPNQDVLKHPIINYTRSPNRRTELTIGVAYDTDLEQAQRVLVDACRSVDGVQKTPEPQAFVFEFGDSSINLSLHFWHAADVASRWRVTSAVAIAVKRALDEAGMTIPFPQRTLWFGPGSSVLRTERAEDDEGRPDLG